MSASSAESIPHFCARMNVRTRWEQVLIMRERVGTRMKSSCCLGLFRVKQMVAASWANNMRQLLLVVVGACVR